MSLLFNISPWIFNEYRSSTSDTCRCNKLKNSLTLQKEKTNENRPRRTVQKTYLFRKTKFITLKFHFLKKKTNKKTYFHNDYSIDNCLHGKVFAGQFLFKPSEEGLFILCRTTRMHIPFRRDWTNKINETFFRWLSVRLTICFRFSFR